MIHSPRAAARAAVLGCLLALLAGCRPDAAPAQAGSPQPQVTPASTAPVTGSSPPPIARASTTPATDSVVAVSASPRLVPAPTVQDFADAVELVRGAGARGAYESATWKELDTSAGMTKVTDSLRYLGNDKGFQLLLGIKVIDTTVKATPADLATVPFDSPVLINRFHALVDALRPAAGKNLRYLSIGNEVDAYLSAHPAEWDAYLRFYTDAVAYAHKRLPGVRVGVTTTFDSVRGPDRARVARLQQTGDVWILTYYPLGAGFVPRAPDTAGPDLAEMTRLAGDRPLVLQEVGYPSATRLSSSEQAQAAFLRAVLAAWKPHGARIPFLNWLGLHDWTPAMCDEFSRYYGLAGDANFSAYLCSLGLRHANGTPKAAWSALLESRAQTG